MTLRNGWAFGYKQADVAWAAKKKADYHKKRIAYWKEELEKAKAAVQDSGIEVRDYDVTGGLRHEVVIDPTLSNRLSEVQGKIKKHEGKAEEYDNWVEVLDVNQFDNVMQLNADDVFYFGLGASHGFSTT